MKLASILLFTVMLVLPGSVSSQKTPDITKMGPFYIQVAGEDVILTCSKPTMDGFYMVAATGCELKPGHTLDEVVSAMLRALSDTQKEREQLRKDFTADLKNDIKAFNEIHRKLDKMQEDLNHGIPLKKGEPKS